MLYTFGKWFCLACQVPRQQKQKNKKAVGILSPCSAWFQVPSPEAPSLSWRQGGVSGAPGPCPPAPTQLSACSCAPPRGPGVSRGLQPHPDTILICSFDSQWLRDYHVPGTLWMPPPDQPSGPRAGGQACLERARRRPPGPGRVRQVGRQSRDLGLESRGRWGDQMAKGPRATIQIQTTS